VARGFDDVYLVKDNYKRFDQRNSAFGQSIRKNGYMLRFATEEARVVKIKKNQPGYTLLDYAYHDAAGMYERLPGEQDSQGTGFYKWSSLGVAVKPDEIPRWEGTPEKTAKIITKAAKFFGAGDVGFTLLDKRWVYSYSRYGKKIIFDDVVEGFVTKDTAVIPNSHKWVIAMTVPMEYEEHNLSPSPLEVATGMGYSRMHLIAGQLAEFIRGLGYNAVPHGNDTSLSVPIAIQTGLGHVGRHGRLITWEHGPLVRICKIFTDLPLPQSPMAPEGIIEFCEVCQKCAKYCPGQAITDGPRTYEAICDSNNPGVFKWYNNEEACLSYWEQVMAGCGICFRVCNFTKPKGITHDIVKWFIRNVPQLNRFWVWTDELIGYGKQSDPSKYWE
jgi:reductive dehalogenase